MLTSLSWVVLTVFAALPLPFSIEREPTDAFFEAMSGITTTGATVIVNLDEAPHGLCYGVRSCNGWRNRDYCMALAVLPLLRVGGMQLFRMESSDQSEKAMPRAAQWRRPLGSFI